MPSTAAHAVERIRRFMLSYFKAASAACASRIFFFQERASSLLGSSDKTWLTSASAWAYRPDSQSERTGPFKVWRAESPGLLESSESDSTGLGVRVSWTGTGTGAAAGLEGFSTGAIGSVTAVTAWLLFCEALRFWRDTSEPTMLTAMISPAAAMSKR